MYFSHFKIFFKIIPSSKNSVTWWTKRYDYSRQSCKKSHQNSTSRSDFGLMSAQKKGIYLYNFGFCILSYYRGGLLLAQTTPTVVGAGLPWDFPPTLTQAFPCLLWVIFPWFWVINSLIIHAESWPNSADFWCVPQKFVGFVAWLSLAPVMLGQCFSWVILGPVRRILKRRCPCLRCRAGRKSLSGWAIHPHPDMLGVGVLPIVR